jgi:hypothetical protein
MNHTKRVIGLRSRTRAIFHYRHLTHRTGTAAPLSKNMSRKSLYADLVAKRLKAAADNLPPLSEIAIYSHHGYDSEHPYKILVGHNSSRPSKCTAESMGKTRPHIRSRKPSPGNDLPHLSSQPRHTPIPFSGRCRSRRAISNIVGEYQAKDYE